jgi:hypothetical protein
MRSALPPFADITSVGHLWRLWKGDSSSSSSLGWEAREAQGPGWRTGERKRWHELSTVLREVQRLAKDKRVSPERAAAIMDAERTCTMAKYI